jgi:hypothetical protein
VQLVNNKPAEGSKLQHEPIAWASQKTEGTQYKLLAQLVPLVFCFQKLRTVRTTPTAPGLAPMSWPRLYERPRAPKNGFGPGEMESVSGNIVLN